MKNFSMIFIFAAIALLASVSAQTSYIDAISRNQSIGNSASNLVFVDNTNSRVAIGSSTPLSTLHVNGSGASWAGLFVSNNTQQIFHVNATSGNIGVGTQNATQKLTIQDGGVEQVYGGGNPRVVGGVDVGLVVPIGINVVRVYGEYAFVGKDVASGNCSGTDIPGCEFSIIDISDPTNPKNLSGFNHEGSINEIRVAGKYAYNFMGSSGTGLCNSQALFGCEFRIMDISNISSPVLVGGVDTSSTVESADISGKYAFIGKSSNNGACSGTSLGGCEFSIFDVSDPRNIVNVSGVDIGNGLSAINIIGRYAYIATGADSGTCSGQTLTGCEFSIIDISDPANPVNVSGIDLGNGNINVLAVSGGYAFLGKNINNGACTNTNVAGCEFTILNISNPSAIGNVSGIDRTSVNAIKLFGKYAALAANNGTCPGTGCKFQIADISNVSAPRLSSFLVLGNSTVALDIQGKYAYLALDANSGNEFLVIDLGGLDAPAASIGNIAADRVDVSDSMRVGNNLQAGSLNVGTLGVYSQGPVSIFSSASSSSLLSVVKSGTALFTVMDTGRVGVGNVTAPTHALTVMGGGNFTQNLTVSSQSGGFNISGITLYNESNRAVCIRIRDEGTFEAIAGGC